MKRKELTETFMMISNRKKPFGFHGLYQNIPVPQGLRCIHTILLKTFEKHFLKEIMHIRIIYYNTNSVRLKRDVLI